MSEIRPTRPVRIITDDGRFYTCRKCGFVCDKHKVLQAKRYENVGETISNVDGDPIVKRGCPFCGSPMSRRG